jgi:hypothetical protein
LVWNSSRNTPTRSAAARAFERDVAWLGALEDLVDERGGVVKQILDARAVAEQRARLRLGGRAERRQAALDGERGDERGMGEQLRRLREFDCADRSDGLRRKGGLVTVGAEHLDGLQLHVQRLGDRRHHVEQMTVRGEIVRHEKARALQRGRELLEQSQPLGQHFRGEDRRTCDVAAGMGEAGGETKADGIADCPHDNGNGRRRAMRRIDARAARHDHVHVQAHEFLCVSAWKSDPVCGVIGV